MKVGKVLRGILGLAARPVRKAQGRGGVVLQPYRGYGSRDEIFLIGRVFRQSPASARSATDAPARQLRDVARRLMRRAVRGATVTARFCGAEQRVETDRDGYFRIHLRPATPPPDDRDWHEVALSLDGPEPCTAKARVFVPPAHCRYVVISDIDDTVMYTGVANKLGMLWRLFVEGPASRTAFPGVPAFYRALHDGAGGDERNPMLYVSRGPWGIYDILDAFFRAHDIPVGPILFLREWGVHWTSPLPRRATEHKRELIDNMLALYRDLPFVLIGDSGQHDPEVYRRIIADHPGRVLAVYIRNVSKSGSRAREIEAMAAEVVREGSSLVLAAESPAMAEHAAALGLVPPDAIATVRAAMAAEHAAPHVRATRIVHADAPEQAEEAIGEAGESENVRIEPKRRRR